MSYSIRTSNPLDLSADALAFMEKRIDYDGGTAPVYVGYAKQPNSNVDDPIWFIIQITNDVNDNPTHIQLPDQGVAFKYEWAIRSSYFS